MNQFAGRPSDAPVPRIVDKTGLAGIYDVRLSFAGTPTQLSASDLGPADAGPSVFDAVREQLGLKLQKVKDVSVDVLIVDRSDRIPTDN
jgi:uncharacterized protein (TIGR03435 family)